MQKKKFTHYGRFYGVPCFINPGENTEVQGKNKFCDWMILHVCPRLHTITDFLHQLWHRKPMPGFPIEILGELKGDEQYVD
jgi:hypothetical protein